MALLLTLNRHIHKAYNRTREFNFSLQSLTGFDLHGKTVGIIGTGKIGMIFANICKGFGMNILAYDKFPGKNDLSYVELDTLLSQSDIISLHCPLTEETHHIIGKAAIGKMKPGAVIVNTSRGGLGDTEALIDGIKTGRFLGFRHGILVKVSFHMPNDISKQNTAQSDSCKTQSSCGSSSSSINIF